VRFLTLGNEKICTLWCADVHVDVEQWPLKQRNFCTITNHFFTGIGAARYGGEADLRGHGDSSIPAGGVITFANVPLMLDQPALIQAFWGSGGTT
jgi:hypothetical protein